MKRGTSSCSGWQSDVGKSWSGDRCDEIAGLSHRPGSDHLTIEFNDMTPIAVAKLPWNQRKDDAIDSAKHNNDHQKRT